MMTTQFERLTSALPQADHDEAKSDTPHRSSALNDLNAPQSQSAGSPQAKTGDAQVPTDALYTSYTSQPIDREKQLEVLTIGNVRLEMLGDLRQALAKHRDRRCQQFFDYWLTLANARQALPSRQTIDP